MKILTEPKVYLISRPKINWDGIDEYFRDSGYSWTGKSDSNNGVTDGDLLTEFGGRICYCSFGQSQGRKSNKEYIENIVSSGHGSVIEHSNYTFLVTGAGRGFTHEMVRHRAGFAYSQESTHYRNYSEESGVICMSPELAKNKSLAEKISSHHTTTLKLYNETYNSLKNSGYKKKDACSMARDVLPNGLESKLVMTGNARALRHFMEMRGNEHNVIEIRLVASKVYDIMKKEAPNMMTGIEKTIAEDGYPTISSVYKKI